MVVLNPRRLLRVLRHSLILSGFLSSAVAQQPDETVLPGESPPSAQVVPDERALPGAEPATPSASLPSETVLPGGPAGDATAADAGIAGVSPGELRPWLRLNLPGHTGRILAVAADPAGKYLVSGGEDKDLHVWSRPDSLPAVWSHRRTLRWQIERGPRGRLYAVAASRHGTVMAGHGATGGVGEIWSVDPFAGALQRALVDVEQGHRQVIAALDWAPGEVPRVASADVAGQVLLWQPDPETGLWRSRTLVPPDRQRYGDAVAAALAPRRRFVRIRFAGPDHLIVPRYVGPAEQPAGAARWQLERIEIDSGNGEILDGADHLEFVTALAVSPDGSRMASADALGGRWLWTLGEEPATESFTSPGVSLAMDFGADGNRLLVGNLTTDAASAQRGALELWETAGENAAPRRRDRLETEDELLAAAFSPATGQAVYAQANRLLVVPIDAAGSFEPAETQTLAPPVRPVRHTAFASELPYRIGLGTGPAAEGEPRIEEVFDLAQIQLGRQAEVDPAVWREADAARGAWSIRPDSEAPAGSFRLFRGDTPAARLPLRPELHGVPTAEVWIADADGVPAAVAVGTDGRDNIYVFGLREEGVAPVLRQFRGHSGTVLSLGTSPDGRYLVSGSADATVALWMLQDVLSDPPTVNRWGATFAVEAGQVVVAEVREDGPLYFRGVRSGDALVSLSWMADSGPRTVADPTAIEAALVDVPFDALVVFQFSRRGRARSGFQSFSAWQPVASLFVDADRQWAFWTPAGFYDASFDGHKRFGWQINRGIDALPDFFSAAQFRRRLERPAAMRRLLQTGSLPAALRETLSLGPPPGEGAIVNQSRLRPRIRLIEPRDGAIVTSGEVTVQAEIEIPLGAVAVPPKVFANGVPAVERQRVAERETATGRLFQYRWRVLLPGDRQISLQVLAATDAEAVGQTTIRLEQPQRPPQRRRPRMYVITAGINTYADPQIQSLDYAARGAQEVATLLRREAAPLYQVEATQLVDGEVTRALWGVFTAEAAARLATDVLPDDLVVMYLSGHGLRDTHTDTYYFVTADARYVDIMNDRYASLISPAELAAFVKLPCRKLAILDTCHSGAVQPALRPQDLKAALRALQEDVVFTLTASEGDEEAVEEREARLGRFTARLLEALEGGADRAGDRNGIVTLDETVGYVQRMVAEDSRADGFIQRPTAGPLDLLPFVELPLTAR